VVFLRQSGAFRSCFGAFLCWLCLPLTRREILTQAEIRVSESWGYRRGFGSADRSEWVRELSREWFRVSCLALWNPITPLFSGTLYVGGGVLVFGVHATHIFY